MYNSSLFMCPADPTYWSSSIGHFIPFDVGLSGADGVGQINLSFRFVQMPHPHENKYRVCIHLVILIFSIHSLLPNLVGHYKTRRLE